MSAGQAVRRAIEAITKVEQTGLNAAVGFDPGVLLEQAAAREHDQKPGPLAERVIAIKDNICTLEYPTTCASRILDGYVSPYEATAVTRLKEAGALIACKTNLDEFGMGSSTEHSVFGRTQHPEHSGLVPGGSSGGSAALVATGAIDAALGSETGGSVRQPAAFCGVVGIKPTYGRVSRYGLVAFGSSLDQIGVFGRSVAMAADVLCEISGRDRYDVTCADRDPLRLGEHRDDLARVTIGVPTEYFPDDLDAGVRAACENAIRRLRDAGAAIRRVSLPHTQSAIATYYVIAPAEASANLARFDGVRYGLRIDGDVGSVRDMYRATRGNGFGAEVKRRIVVGTYVLSAGYYDAYYRRALRARALITQDFHEAFANGVDLLFTPTTPTTAFAAGEKLHDPLAMYLSDLFVVATNLAGLPAISVPIGRHQGLPVGGQLIAPAFEEDRLIHTARVLERAVDREAEAL